MTRSTFLRANARLAWLIAAAWLVPSAGAAETTDPMPMTKTFLTLKVDAQEPLTIRSTFQERPPTITLTFSGQRVIAALPERSPVAQGVIQAVTARYEGVRAPRTASRRTLRSLDIVLTAPYSFRVRSEAGRVVVEIEHPTSIGSTSVEVGLRGGTVISGIGRVEVSDRFRAMQEAMERAASASWTFQANSAPQGVAAPEMILPSSPQAGISAAGSSAAARLPQPADRVRSAWWPSAWLLLLAMTGLIGFGAWRFLTGLVHAANGSAITRGRSQRVPSGVMLIDQLVWRAFERQGYHLILETELIQPLIGTLRIVTKEGPKSALLFLGHGPFFEKQTVERFIHIMRDANVEQGLLIASGSFTVPAQRLAKERRVTLIGREQLTELLSAGAGSEYFTKQLAQSQARLEETKETLRQYAGELDTLRRQRNEASWYLGEEREKTGKLEVQLEELTQQLRRYEIDIHRWEQDAAALRKQWTESQWYLGESAARVRHMEAQLSALQDVAKHVESAERARDEMKWYLGEEQTKTESLHAQLVSLQQHLDDAARRETTLQGELARLGQALESLRTCGNRRARLRAAIPQAFIELFNGEETPIFSGMPRDLSGSGVGLETDRELPAFQSVRVRLRLPGQERPVTSRARLMWHRAEGQPTTYRGGCKFIGVSASTRARIEQLVEETWKSAATPSA